MEVSYIRAALRRPLVAKIHRDLLLNPLSEPGEIDKLSDGWDRALKLILNSYTPIVIGYGGNDGSLMGLMGFLNQPDIYHVVKDATKVRLLTGAGLIDAKVVQVDAANDLALLKADGKFSPLPISSSRSAQLGGTVATVGFPDIGLQGFAPKVLAHGHQCRGALARAGRCRRSLRTATN